MITWPTTLPLPFIDYLLENNPFIQCQHNTELSVPDAAQILHIGAGHPAAVGNRKHRIACHLKRTVLLLCRKKGQLKYRQSGDKLRVKIAGGIAGLGLNGNQLDVLTVMAVDRCGEHPQLIALHKHIGAVFYQVELALTQLRQIYPQQRVNRQVKTIGERNQYLYRRYDRTVLVIIHPRAIDFQQLRQSALRKSFSFSQKFDVR